MAVGQLELNLLSQPNSTQHNSSWSDNVIDPSPTHQKLLDHFQGNLEADFRHATLFQPN